MQMQNEILKNDMSQ